MTGAGRKGIPPIILFADIRKMGERTGRPRGRPPGAKNKRTEQRAKVTQEVAQAITETIPEAFTGDAHAFLMAVYKDPQKPIDQRLDAAKAAIRYEKPALSSVEAKHSGEMTVNGGIDAPPRAESYEEWNARRQRELQAVGAAAGSAASSH